MQLICQFFGIVLCISIFFMSTIQGLDIGVRKTSCSLAKGNYNNPCESLYDAVCDGAHCKCPSGFREDKALRRCVKGSTKSSKGTDDLFDLPFDYDPNEKKDPSTGPKESPSDAQSPTGTQNNTRRTYPEEYPQQLGNRTNQFGGTTREKGSKRSYFAEPWVLTILVIMYLYWWIGKHKKQILEFLEIRNSNPSNVPPGHNEAYPMNALQGQQINNVRPEQNCRITDDPPPYDQLQHFMPYQSPGPQHPLDNITPGRPEAPPPKYSFCS